MIKSWVGHILFLTTIALVGLWFSGHRANPFTINAAENSTPIITFADNTFHINVASVNQVEYTLAYSHRSPTNEVIEEKIQGSVGGPEAHITAFAGTCSENQECTPHKGIESGRVELQINGHNNTHSQFHRSFTLTDNQLWLHEEAGFTLSQVSLDKTYHAPQNQDINLRFTSLPSPAGSVTIRLIPLSDTDIKALGAVSTVGVEITSSMADGTFTYDLQLPVPADVATNKLTIKYAETIQELSQAVTVEEPVTVTNEEVTAVGLDHFTVFVVVNPSAAQDTGAGLNWIDEEKVFSSNNDRAHVAFPFLAFGTNVTQQLKASNYGLAVPANAVIEGIQVRIERQLTPLLGVNARDHTVMLMKAGTAVGTNKAMVGAYPVSDAYQVYGGATDLWGATWTPAEVNAVDFGVAFAAQRGASFIAQVVSVDHMEVQVFYNTPPTITITSPNGAEVWQGGSTQPITWIATDPDSDIVTITLEYTTDGTTFVPIATGLANTGTYDWTLPTIDSSTVSVRATATDPGMLSGDDVSDATFTIDSTAPVITVNILQTQDTTPALTGTVNDPTATIVITVNGNNYPATNNGDGTWTLADNTISPALNPGLYSVLATATDEAGNIGTDTTKKELKIHHLGLIQGLKFRDRNGDGFFNLSELLSSSNYLNNWNIRLYDAEWELLDEMLTGNDSTAAGPVINGQYRFANLYAGTYYVCEELRSDWIQTFPYDGVHFFHADEVATSDAENTAPHCYQVELDMGEFQVLTGFGNFKEAQVSGYKWEDKNGDGEFNRNYEETTEVQLLDLPLLEISAGEHGLAGWTIFIDLDEDGELDENEPSTQTNESGYYSLNLDGLLPGTYLVCEVNQVGWEQIYPGENSCHTIVVTTSGQTFEYYNFGNKQLPPPETGGPTGGTTTPTGPADNNAKPPVCTENAPSTAPANLHISSSTTNSVTLQWNPVSPVTHYALIFTNNSTGVQYGSVNIGNTTSYTVNGLSGGTTYTFEIFGVNGCAPGARASVTSSRFTGPILEGRPVGGDGQVLGSEVGEEVTLLATESADIASDSAAKVLGTDSLQCSNKSWWWLVPVIGGLFALLIGVIAPMGMRRLILAATALVAAVLLFMSLCSAWPWIIVSLIAVGLWELFLSLFRNPQSAPVKPVSPRSRRR